MSSAILGLDIGGANIKYCSSAGNSGSLPFELWKQPEQLASILETIPNWKQAECFGVTMTGELADCFQTKAEGVSAICDAVETAANNRPALFYQTSGDFVDTESATSAWELTAASNWHGLASLVGKIVTDCVVIDLGSTTTDIIPVKHGKPCPLGNNDLTRLAAGELLYTGVVRSPVCAVVGSVDLEDQSIPVAQELFANMLDVYVLLNRIAETESCRHTADGRAATKRHCRKRLARMLCAESHELSAQVVDEIAAQIATEHLSTIRSAIERVIDREQLKRVVAVGEGRFLIEEALSVAASEIEVMSPGDVVGQFYAQSRPVGIDTASAMVYLLSEQLAQSAR